MILAVNFCVYCCSCSHSIRYLVMYLGYPSRLTLSERREGKKPHEGWLWSYPECRSLTLDGSLWSGSDGAGVRGRNRWRRRCRRRGDKSSRFTIWQSLLCFNALHFLLKYPSRTRLVRGKVLALAVNAADRLDVHSLPSWPSFPHFQHLRGFYNTSSSDQTPDTWSIAMD